MKKKNKKELLKDMLINKNQTTIVCSENKPHKSTWENPGNIADMFVCISRKLIHQESYQHKIHITAANAIQVKLLQNKRNTHELLKQKFCKTKKNRYTHTHT